VQIVSWTLPLDLASQCYNDMLMMMMYVLIIVVDDSYSITKWQFTYNENTPFKFYFVDLMGIYYLPII